MHLTAVEAESGRNIGTSTVMVKPLKFDRSMSWRVFHRQFEAVVDHSGWEAMEKAIHLLAILQGQAANILHSGRAEATCEDNCWDAEESLQRPPAGDGLLGTSQNQNEGEQ